MLGGLGHQVVGEVSGGSDAVGLYSFRTTKPDLVLMDVDVPFLEGLSAIGQIRKIHATAQIILLTGSSTPMEEIKNIGVLGVLRKPCHPETLSGILAQYETVYRQRLTQVHVRPKVAVKEKK
jgi:two-component system chemotaxis response regulator CheY